MKTSTELSFSIMDVTAKADSSPSASNRQPFTDLLDLKKDGLTAPLYATCEHNQFLLDAGRLPFPDQPQGLPWGLWSSAMSDENGRFSQVPVLLINFSQPHSSLGFTLHFGNDDYASEIYIRWYDSSGYIIAQRGFSPDSPVYFASHKVESFYKVEIEFRKTHLPYRYLKLLGIDYGIRRTFGGAEIVSASLLEECNLLSSELSVNTLSFSLYSDNAEFSMLNAQGVFSALQQHQDIQVRELVDGQTIEMGTFYLNAWENETANISRFEAVDALGLLDKDTFLGGVYSDIPASTLIADILGNQPYLLSPTLAQVKLSGHIPICTRREALQYTAFALCAVVDCSRGSSIAIEPVPSRPSRYIAQSRKFPGGTLVQKQQITGADVTARTYLPGTETEEIFRDTLGVGEHFLQFDSPVHTLSATGASILQSGAHWAQIKVEASGEVILSGMQYSSAPTVLQSRRETWSVNTPADILRVEDAPLVNVSNVNSIASGILNYYDKRCEHEFTMLPVDERLADMVIVETLGTEKLKGLIERMEIDLTGGFRAKVKVVGTRIDTTLRYYASEIYSGERMGVV